MPGDTGSIVSLSRRWLERRSKFEVRSGQLRKSRFGDDTITTEPRLDKQRETELTRALMDGHAGAFEEFVEHFRSKIFQYSWLMCGQREDAEAVRDLACRPAPHVPQCCRGAGTRQLQA